MELDQYDQALGQINSLLNSDLKPFDRAKSLELRGYIYAAKDNYAQAAKDWEASLATGALAEFTILDMYYRLAQVYAATEQYNRALQNLEKWFARAENPGAEALFLAAQLYYVAGRPQDSVSYVERGLAKMVEPRQSWYEIAVAVYYENNQYTKAIPILEKMITLWANKKAYYTQLSGFYMELDRERDHFAVMALAYDNDLLSKSDEIVRLAQLYRMYDYPYRASKVLEKEISTGRVKKTSKNWEELGNAWLQSREHKKAIQPLTNAAGLSKDGEIYLRLCQTYVSNENWGEASRDCGNAVNKGGLKNNGGLAWELLGIARYNQKNRNTAKDAFDKCLDWESTEKDCLRWINHIDNEIKFEEQEKLRQEKDKKAAIERAAQQEKDVKRVLLQREEAFTGVKQ
jgi:tetratricopeptide (TPR) repeat protein